MALMTQKTLKRLKDELLRVEAHTLKWKRQISEVAGEESDWHDNAAFDQAQSEYETAVARLLELKEAVDNAKIIEPETRIDRVRLGNKVRFLLNGQEREFTLLGEYDGQTDKSWISFQSPVGEAIMGLKPGQIGRMGDGEVGILEINRGEF